MKKIWAIQFSQLIPHIFPHGVNIYKIPNRVEIPRSLGNFAQIGNFECWVMLQISFVYTHYAGFLNVEASFRPKY